MKSVIVILAAFFSLNTWAAQRANASTSSDSMPAPSFNGTLIDSPVYLMPQMGLAAMSLRSSDGATGVDTGLSLGTLVDLGRHSLSLESGLLYNQFGGKNDSTQFNVSYISIPTLVKWNVLGVHDQTVYFKGGFLTSILTDSNVKVAGQTGSTGLGANTFDFGFLFGVGGTYSMSSKVAFVFDVSYLRGLTTVTDKINSSARNEGFIFSSGLSIAL